MATMKLSDLELLMMQLRERCGDIPVVLYDLDTGGYYSLLRENVEAQRMADGSVRVSIGVNDYEDPHEDEPAVRPL